MLTKVTKVKVLGSTMSEDGELDEEVERRSQTGWRNWRRMSDVLCGKRLSARRKEKGLKVGRSETSHDLWSGDLEH